jgi:CrcB protein
LTSIGSGFTMFVPFKTAHTISEDSSAGVFKVIDGLTQIVFTLAISMSALALGLHFANLILPHIPLKLPTVRYPIRYALSISSVIAYILTIPMYFILPHRYRAEATAALLFSFPGALLRHIISIKLNPLNKSFPLGTFAVNLLGTLLVGTFHSLQRDHGHSGSLSCVMLQALMDGFCGCLSTVSTFAVEIRGLRVRAWVYAGASIFAAQLVLVFVTGIPRWTGAISEPAKCTFER